MRTEGSLLTAPNLLSAARIPLSLAACVLVARRSVVPALVAIGLAIATDFLDGAVARATGRESDWGRILDPLADKVGVAAFLVTLVLVGAVPLWFLVVVVSRDLLIAAGGIYLTRRVGSPPSSNTWGKLATLLLSVYMTLAALTYMTGLRVWPERLSAAGLDPLGMVSLAFVLASFWSYLSLSIRTLRDA